MYLPRAKDWRGDFCFWVAQGRCSQHILCCLPPPPFGKKRANLKFAPTKTFAFALTSKCANTSDCCVLKLLLRTNLSAIQCPASSWCRLSLPNNQRLCLCRTPVRQRWQGIVPLSIYFFVCYLSQGRCPRTPTTFWKRWTKTLSYFYIISPSWYGTHKP